MKISIERLHNIHCSPIRRDSGQTIYVVAELIGYMQILRKSPVFVVLENNDSVDYVIELFEGWISTNKPGPDFIYHKAERFLFKFGMTGNSVMFITRFEYESNQNWEGEYVIFDESADWNPKLA